MVAEHGCSTRSNRDIRNEFAELIPEWLNLIMAAVFISRENLQQNKILRVIKKNLAKKCLATLAEMAELKDDCTGSFEQFGKCLKHETHEDSTVGAKIAELLRLNDSAPEDEQLDLKEYVDCTKGELNDETIDITVVRQSRVPTIQPVQKTVEVPQVQFLDRMIDVPIEETKILQRTTERVMDIPVPQVAEESIEMFNVLSQDHVQQRNVERTIEETIDVPVTRVMEKTIEGVKQIPQVQKTVEVPQIQFIDEAVDVPVVMRRQVPVVQKMQKTVEASQVQSTDEVMNALVTMQRHVPAVQVAQKSIASPAENHHLTQGAENYRDEDRVDKVKTKAKSGLENHCTAMRNTSIVKEMRSKFEVGHTKVTEENVHGRNRSDKDRRIKRQGFEATRHPPAIRSVQKTVEVPRVQYIDKVADIPVDMQGQVFTIQAAQDIDEVEGVPALTQSEVPNIPDDDEDWLEQESKKRKLPMPADAVSENRADESDFDRFGDLVLPSRGGRTLFVNIASGDEAEDEPEKQQEMTLSLVQGGESMLVDETDARSPGREMVQAIYAEWSQE